MARIPFVTPADVPANERAACDACELLRTRKVSPTTFARATASFA